MRTKGYFVTGLIATWLLLGGCSTTRGTASSTHEYLYPDGERQAMEPGRAVIEVPAAIGIAFVPAAGARFGASLDPDTRRNLLGSVKARFEQYDFVGRIEIIPSAYLSPGGGFRNLRQIAGMHDVGVMALVSHDQVQISEEGVASITYWTIAGAYIIPGQKNSTSTLVDTAVFDVDSRRMLFRAPGTSRIQRRSTPVNLPQALREDGVAGFEEATAQMMGNLEDELTEFRDTVRSRPEDFRVEAAPGHTGGGGSMPVLLLMAGLGALSCRAHARGAGVLVASRGAPGGNFGYSNREGDDAPRGP